MMSVDDGKRNGMSVDECCKQRLTKRTITSPIGSLVLIACDQGVHGLCQTNEINDENFCPDDNQGVVEVLGECGVVNKHVEDCILWLRCYFGDLNQISSVRLPNLCFSGQSPFRIKTWQTLIDSLPGETLSYSELCSKAFGHRNASRAIGSALKNNPVQLLVPCHRVIKASGNLGHYAGGSRNRVKAFLINHEDKWKTTDN